MSFYHTPWDRFLHIGVFPLPCLRRLRITGAPAYLQGLRLLFVSDVHLRRCVRDNRLQALTDLIAAQEADMLLLGGDYGEGRVQCKRLLKALGALSFPLGCYAVPGNNDRWEGLEAMAAEAGICLLRNACRRIDLPGGALEIGGCDDHEYGAPETRDLFSDGAAYRILLSHFPILPDCSCELMLSGHTHAGQINFFGLTPYSIAFERHFALQAVRGEKRIGDMLLSVCGGIGVSCLPLRMGAAPEILLAEFAG